MPRSRHSDYSDDSADYGQPITIVKTNIENVDRYKHHQRGRHSPDLNNQGIFLGVPEQRRRGASMSAAQGPVNIVIGERSPSRERRRPRGRRDSSSSSSRHSHRGRHDHHRHHSRSSSREHELRRKLRELELDKEKDYVKQQILRDMQREENRKRDILREAKVREREEQEERDRIVKDAERDRDERKRKKKEEDERAVDEWKHEQVMKEEKKKKEEEEYKKKFEDDFKKTMLARGYDMKSIEAMLKKKDNKDPSSSSSLVPVVDLNRPTYIKINRKYIHPDTLDAFNLPWEWDRHDTQYIIIKRWIDHHFQEELFAHSARIFREGSSGTRLLITDSNPVIRETRLTPNDALGRAGDGLYVVRRKSTGARDRSRRRSALEFFAS